ncbi:TFIID-18kDa-domain-containing protein, partial [Suhomyces tanzawaensis NRRL Y-17324]
RRKKFQGLFLRDIEYLLYALGDRPVSSDATVLCLDDIMVEFLVDLCHEVMGYSKSQGRSRVKMNDLVFAFRNDPLKLARFEYINKQNYRIQKAKKMFEEKTGNFDEEGGGLGGGGMEDNSDEDDDDDE